MADKGEFARGDAAGVSGLGEEDEDVDVGGRGGEAVCVDISQRLVALGIVSFTLGILVFGCDLIDGEKGGRWAGRERSVRAMEPLRRRARTSGSGEKWAVTLAMVAAWCWCMVSMLKVAS